MAALHIEVISTMGERPNGLETMQKVGTSQWQLTAELRVRWGFSQRGAGVMGRSMLFRWVRLEGIQAGRGRPGVVM